MRTREQIQCMCDGCNKTANGFRVNADVMTPQGPAAIGSITPPIGWSIALVRPALATPSGQPDANMPAMELARATGCAVQAALCEKCARKVTFVPIKAEETLVDLGDGNGPQPSVLDERAAERERERLAAEQAAEAAERAAFEAKRAQGATESP